MSAVVGLEGLVAPDAEVEKLATGFGFTEGPAWSDADQFLVFSDIPGDTLHRWDPEHGVSVYRHPSHKGNGNTFDPAGRLLTCEHSTSRLVREEGGEVSVLAERFEGRELNSPNDVVVAADGSIWFTDPTYGRNDYYGRPRPTELDVRALYRLTTDGELEQTDSGFVQPNGLCFSPDGRTLYVNDSEVRHIRSYAVGADGSLSGGEVWVEVVGEEPGNPDGMKADTAGNVWVTGPGGIHVFGPDTSLLGKVAMPETVANLAWGGPERDALYICASTSLYRLATLVRGHRPT